MLVVGVTDVRDTLIQALGLVVCYPASLAALENVTLERSVMTSHLIKDTLI